MITLNDLINEIDDKVKNPLTVILLVAQDLEKNTKDKEFKKKLKIIIQQVYKIDLALNAILRSKN